MKEYLHEGTVIHTNLYYTVENFKRVYIEQEPEFNPKKALFHFEAYLQPPLMCMPSAWDRYNFCKQDITSTYEKLDNSFTWQISLLLLYGIDKSELSGNGVESTFQSLFTFLFKKKKEVLTNLLQYVKPNEKNEASVLCRERPDHRPLLPKIQILESDFESLKLIIPVKEPCFNRVVRYPSKYKFKDIFMIPMNFDEENNLIYMTRIIPKLTYDDWPIKRKPCVLTLPTIVNVEDSFYIVTDEACFFSSNATKRKLIKMTVKKSKKIKT